MNSDFNGMMIYAEGPDGECIDLATVKTKWSHPYSYDPIVQFIKSGSVIANGTIYTDRLYQWDFSRANELQDKHFGSRSQYWDRFQPKDIEAFLRDWCNDPELELIKIVEYCNVSTGYPTWRLDYNTKTID